MSDLTIAPQHGPHLDELDPHVIENVAYSPLKTRSLMNYDPDSPVYCKSCDWETTTGALPETQGGSDIQPDMCPDCAKDDELGFVRSRPLAQAAVATNNDL